MGAAPLTLPGPATLCVALPAAAVRGAGVSS